MARKTRLAKSQAAIPSHKSVITRAPASIMAGLPRSHWGSIRVELSIMTKPLSIISVHHLSAIGAVVVNWQAVEMVMELTMLGLYEISPDRGLVITSNLSFSNKLTILQILALRGAIADKEEAQNLASILKRIEEASKQRNRIVHGLWGPSSVQGLAERKAIRVRGRRLSAVTEKVPLAEVEGIARDILDLRFELSELAVRLGLRPELATGKASSSAQNS